MSNFLVLVIPNNNTKSACDFLKDLMGSSTASPTIKTSLETHASSEMKLVSELGLAFMRLSFSLSRKKRPLSSTSWETTEVSNPKRVKH